MKYYIFSNDLILFSKLIKTKETKKSQPKSSAAPNKKIPTQDTIISKSRMPSKPIENPPNDPSTDSKESKSSKRTAKPPKKFVDFETQDKSQTSQSTLAASNTEETLSVSSKISRETSLKSSKEIKTHSIVSTDESKSVSSVSEGRSSKRSLKTPSRLKEFVMNRKAKPEIKGPENEDLEPVVDRPELETDQKVPLPSVPKGGISKLSHKTANRQKEFVSQPDLSDIPVTSEDISSTVFGRQVSLSPENFQGFFQGFSNEEISDASETGSQKSEKISSHFSEIESRATPKRSNKKPKKVKGVETKPEVQSTLNEEISSTISETGSRVSPKRSHKTPKKFEGFEIKPEVQSISNEEISSNVSETGSRVSSKRSHKLPKKFEGFETKQTLSSAQSSESNLATSSDIREKLKAPKKLKGFVLKKKNDVLRPAENVQVEQKPEVKADNKPLQADVKIEAKTEAKDQGSPGISGQSSDKENSDSPQGFFNFCIYFYINS